MHDHVVEIEGIEGAKVSVLFTHAAFLRLERDHGLRVIPAVNALADHSVAAIEAALLCGVEGHREAILRAGKPTSLAEVRALLDGPLAEVPYSKLVNALVEAITRGTRRGKAPAATTPQT